MHVHCPVLIRLQNVFAFCLRFCMYFYLFLCKKEIVLKKFKVIHAIGLFLFSFNGMFINTKQVSIGLSIFLF